MSQDHGSRIKYTKRILSAVVLVYGLVLFIICLHNVHYISDTKSVIELFRGYKIDKDILKARLDLVSNISLMNGISSLSRAIVFVLLLMTGIWGKLWSLTVKTLLPTSQIMTQSVFYVVACQIVMSAFDQISANRDIINLIELELRFQILSEQGLFVLFILLVNKKIRPVYSLAIFLTPLLLYRARYEYTILASHQRLPRLKKTEQTQLMFDLLDKEKMPHELVFTDYTDNAYYHGGLFGEVIVIGEEVVKKYPPRGAAAVMAHELGHRRWGHSHYQIATLFLDSIVRCSLPLLFVLPYPWVYSLFGFETEPMVGAIAIGDTLFVLYELLSTPIKNMMEVNFEYTADRYAAHYGYAKDSANAIMTSSAFPLATRPYEYLFSTHPCDLHRAKALLGEGSG